MSSIECRLISDLLEMKKKTFLELKKKGHLRFLKRKLALLLTHLTGHRSDGTNIEDIPESWDYYQIFKSWDLLKHICHT